MTATKHLTDDGLEIAIDQAALKLHTAQTRAARVSAWDELKRLQAQRSAQQIEKMELAQGLR